MFRSESTCSSKAQFCLESSEVRWGKLLRELLLFSSPPGRGSTGLQQLPSITGKMQKLPCSSFWVEMAFVLMVFLASTVGSSLEQGE